MIRVVIREAGERRRRTLHDSGEWEPAALLSRQKSRFCQLPRHTAPCWSRKRKSEPQSEPVSVTQ